jgi:NAD(P)-dependent dehydrogenase (short-subunit alcohol dehydrogenase family)
MSHDLTGRVLVITGASSGIGAATALACARAGMDIVLSGRRADRLAEVAGRAQACNRRAEIVVGDVTAPGLNARLLDVAQERFGRFDVVFANAGYGFTKPTLDLELDELRRIFEVNFFAAYELVWQAARRLLAQRQPGHLLMCSSAVAKFTLRGFGAYSATKAAQNHFCRAMRMELRPHGIEVASVHPITTATEFFEQAARYMGRTPEPRRPLGPPAGWFVQRPEKVAHAVVRCLRRPRPEVWTSGTVRLAAGLMTIFPRMMDAVGRRA